MGRVKIDFPATSIWSMDIPLRIGDINYGGHLSNDALLGILHEARESFLKAHDYSELEVGGCSLIMGDVEIQFKAEGFHGDLLKVEIALGEAANSSFSMFYKVSRKGDLLAMARTGMICFDYKTGKVQAIPEEFRSKFLIT